MFSAGIPNWFAALITGTHSFPAARSITRSAFAAFAWLTGGIASVRGIGTSIASYSIP